MVVPILTPTRAFYIYKNSKLLRSVKQPKNAKCTNTTTLCSAILATMSKVLFRSAVFIIVHDESGRVLLHRRANTGFMDGYYDFPSGHVEHGESFAEAAIRELREETGLVTSESDMSLCHINQNYLDQPYINIIFMVDTWQGTPAILEPNKCDDMQFFDTAMLPEKCTLAVRDVSRTGFTAEPTTSRITLSDFQELVGVPFEDILS